MTVGVIDIGTNTVLLLVARRNETGTLDTVVDLQRTPRLGQGVDKQRMIHTASMERVLHVIQEYRMILEERGVKRVVVAATSAVRDAENRDAFRDLVSRKTGYVVEILSGEDEARCAFLGAISGLPNLHRATVIDIGGGSTEIISGTPNDITEATSLDIGAVRLTERFLKHAPPLDDEVRHMEAWLGTQLSALSSPGTDARLIGVAGTVTSLAAIDLGLAAFDRDAVAGHVLRVERIESLFEELCRRSPPQIRTMSSVMTGREDIITAGTCILLGVMKRLGFDSVTVSERGIRYGLALRELAGRVS